MTFNDFVENLRSRLASENLAEERLKAAAEEIARFFQVRSHEVGLFNVDAGKHAITFRWPLSMAKTGHIPLNAVNSLVAKTANEKVPTLDNSFAGSRHLFMFEHMLAEKSERIAVQKMMSVPVMTGDAAIGVIQVGRKAASREEAGEDFSQDNLADLERIAITIGNHQLL